MVNRYKGIALSQEKIMTKYMLSFYDLFDGWIDAPKFSENEDELINERDAKNAKLAASNINCGEHYLAFHSKFFDFIFLT